MESSPKNGSLFIIYYTHIVANPYDLLFFCGTQKEKFNRTFTLLFSIQWKWMETRGVSESKDYKKH